MRADEGRSAARDAGVATRTQAFWNSHPCDGQESLAELEAYRHAKEPWLPPLLKRICARESQVLEIGCGQGTDGLLICRFMASGGSYIGLDHSDASIVNAIGFAQDVADGLNVRPEFRMGDARALPFADASREAVYSMGVLHHVDDTERAIAEAWRVLMPGGRFYLGLYNSLSVKLLAAHALRAIQSGIDAVTGQDRFIFRKLLASRYGQRTGTMLHECFGVPVLRSYTSSGMRRLLRNFHVDSLASFGSGSDEAQVGGYLWVAEAHKPSAEARRIES